MKSCDFDTKVAQQITSLHIGFSTIGQGKLQDIDPFLNIRESNLLNALVHIPPIDIASVLAIYIEGLDLKLANLTIKKQDVVSIEELFDVELWNQFEVYLEECRNDPEYQRRVARGREALAEMFSDAS